MARKTISELTGLFETGDTPGGADFASIFDSNFNLQETGTSVASGSLNVLTDISASSISSSFQGDGSGLTNVSATAFPFTGDAVITGSLTISGSLHAFTLDSDNVVIGSGSGIVMQAGANNNVLLGTHAGQALTTGDNNVFLGHLAGALIDGELDNICIGYDAGGNTAAGNYRINIGHRAGRQNTSDSSIYMGYFAGYQGDGDNNVGIGRESLYRSTGKHNIAIGYQALGRTAASTFSETIAIGQKAGSNDSGGTGNILIGMNVQKSSAAASGELRIGSGSVHPISASLTTGDVVFPSTASAAYLSTTAGNLSSISASYALTASHALNAGGGGGSIFTTTGGYEQTINNLIISSSNSTSSLSVIGSGSTVFDIEGSVGTLFSAIDSLSGSLMSVTDASGIPILEVFSDATVEAKGFKGYRPIQTQASSFVLQLSDMGTYNRCSGVAITASISASSAMPFAIGTEIEFIQTSSAGNLLITASAGSGITLNSKNGNLKLAGQFSAATLKKVGTDEWDLIGDLT